MDPTLGLLLPPALGLFAGLCMLPQWLADKRAERNAVTPKQKRDVVLTRLIRQYERQGHAKPINAACDHLHMLEDIERYRRWACEEFARTGKTQRTLEDEWLAQNQRSVVKGINDAADVRLYNAVLADTIRNTPAEDVFTYEPALTKWKEADAAFWREHEDWKRNQRLDPVASFVAEAAFAVRDRL